VAIFNFSGSGVGEDPGRLTELDRFARNTFSRELEDLEAVMDRLAVGRAGETVFSPVSRFGLLGHSRGGSTAILKSSTRRQVRAVATWSAVASLEAFAGDFVPVWEAGETVRVENSRTGEELPLRRNVLDDLRAHPDRLDILAAAGSLEIPLLVLHGAGDESVPAGHARQLAEAAGDRADLRILPDTGHTLGVEHPYAGATGALEDALSATAGHFRRHLAPEQG
jgi:pimeloyl-ACP methyl ester carboxylesterase